MKFGKNVNVEDDKSKLRYRTECSKVNIAVVSGSVADNRKSSIRLCSQQLINTKSTLHMISKKVLHFESVENSIDVGIKTN